MNQTLDEFHRATKASRLKERKEAKNEGRMAPRVREHNSGLRRCMDTRISCSLEA